MLIKFALRVHAMMAERVSYQDAVNWILRNYTGRAANLRRYYERMIAVMLITGDV